MLPMATAGRGSPGGHRTATRFFAGPVRAYVLRCAGRPVSVLQAGCQAPLGDPGIGELADGARASELTLPDAPAALSASVRMACAAVSRLSGGRFAGTHDELLCVIRKPRDRFARLV